jgi:hypothetical protein
MATHTSHNIWSLIFTHHFLHLAKKPSTKFQNSTLSSLWQFETKLDKCLLSTLGTIFWICERCYTKLIVYKCEECCIKWKGIVFFVMWIMCQCSKIYNPQHKPTSQNLKLHMYNVQKKKKKKNNNIPLSVLPFGFLQKMLHMSRDDSQKPH